MFLLLLALSSLFIIIRGDTIDELVVWRTPNFIDDISFVFKSLFPYPISILVEDGNLMTVLEIVPPYFRLFVPSSRIGAMFSVGRLLADNSSDIFGRVAVGTDSRFYILYDPKDLSQLDQSLVVDAFNEQKFRAEYLNNNKIPWGNFFWKALKGPRPPLNTFMYDITHIKQKFEVKSKESFWLTSPTWECIEEVSFDCRTAGEVTLSLEVVSTQPRAMIIPNFLSEFEADYLVGVGKEKLRESKVGIIGGDVVKGVRSSNNTWVWYNTGPIVQSIYKRAADVMNMSFGDMMQRVEHVQLVHYENDGYYKPHFDPSQDVCSGRVITLLMYLNNPEGGGGTGFPKAGLSVKAKKGYALLFYSSYPNGNLDEYSLHEGESVSGGEKWLANFWVSDLCGEEFESMDGQRMIFGDRSIYLESDA